MGWGRIILALVYAGRAVLSSSYSFLVCPVLQRITEQAGVVLSLDPKPIEVINLSYTVLLT